MGPSGRKGLCPLPAFGDSHRSVMKAPSSVRSTWIVAFESPFGCPESVNVILRQNLERITARLPRRVLMVESFAKINKLSCVSNKALQLA
jgi:hypothetical protein